MPGRKSRTNPFLILITVLMCLFCGAWFTQSSAAPSVSSEGEMPDMFVANDVDDSAFTSEGTVAETQNFTDESRTTEELTEELTDEVQADPAPVPSEVPPTPTEAPEPSYSPEAERGVWTSSGSHWMFLIDGTPYTGWLTDLDGKTYFFNKDGIMQTGWLDDNGKRYYLNMDGIMQTGDIVVDGTSYHLLEDGSLEGYSSEAPASEQTAEAAPKTESAAGEQPAGETVQPDKTIALTFDDGPSSYTNRLLDCLETNQAKATFFMVGQEIENFPDEVRRMEALGCELGNHSYSHQDLTSLDAEGISYEIGRTDQLLLDLTGHGATVLRPPYGSINDTVTSTVGTPMILWSIDTLDWETMDAQKTVDTVLAEAQDGAIILMHDLFSTSVDAAEILIPELIRQGYQLVTIQELAAAQNTELQSGIAYGSFN